jgi:hypothetical protein
MIGNFNVYANNIVVSSLLLYFRNICCLLMRHNSLYWSIQYKVVESLEDVTCM